MIYQLNFLKLNSGLPIICSGMKKIYKVKPLEDHINELYICLLLNNSFLF